MECSNAERARRFVARASDVIGAVSGKRSSFLRRAGTGLLLGLVLGAPSTASAFTLRHIGSGAPVRWPSSQVTLEVDASVIAAIPGAFDAIVAATSSWSAAELGPQVTLTLATGPSTPAVDGRNVVYFAPDGYPGAEGALAVTLVSYDDHTGDIVDTDIVINGHYPFAVLPPDAAPGVDDEPIANDPATGAPLVETGLAASAPFDLTHVVAHETGHVLGLLDGTDDPSDVMYLYSFPDDASRRGPAADDVAGITALYTESNPASQGCQASPRPSSPAGLSFVPAVVMAWLAGRLRSARRRP